MNQHRDDYQKKTDEFAAAYNKASEALKEQYKTEIMNLFNKFKEQFEKSNKDYIAMMNDLTTALYTKAG